MEILLIVVEFDTAIEKVRKQECNFTAQSRSSKLLMRMELALVASGRLAVTYFKRYGDLR